MSGATAAIPAVDGEVTKVVLPVAGMACAACQARVQRAIG